MKERLQKILAQAGIASRRAAEEYIRAGRVTVDGTVVTEMGLQLDPSRHRITFDGKSISREARHVYILLNKPAGYVTTLSDPQGRPLVTSLLQGVKERVFPVGRLDLNTEGALILTNDGELANRIIHPKYEVNKTYVATVKGRPERRQLRQLETGIVLDGQKTWPAKVRVVREEERSTVVEIVIHEGKKRQVRKMFAAIGHPVLHLQRTAYGRLRLGSLPLGSYRYLKEKDLAQIFAVKNMLYNS
ncbi:MAG: pseudouridine synthase [Thermodesulfobacteriota bacterium]